MVLNGRLLFRYCLLAGEPTVQAQTPALYTAAELDELLAPIALYPDPLLAQILPAATFTDQLQASRECCPELRALQMR